MLLGGNPCRFVKKYRNRSCERFLSEQEFRRLGRVLSELEAEGKASASGIAAFRLLMLTGCRRNEILTLRWEDVDLEAGELRLRDAKTGARQVALSPAAKKVLAALPRLPDNPWVITGSRAGRRLANLNAQWVVVRKRAGLEDVRIHDLRHSFASRALALGESLTMIGKLLGHRQVQTTARYAHLARESVKTSAARVAESIAADMENAAPLPPHELRLPVPLPCPGRGLRLRGIRSRHRHRGLRTASVPTSSEIGRLGMQPEATMKAGSSCSLVAKILQPIRRAGCWEVYKLPKKPNEESYAVSMKRVNDDDVVSVSPPFPVQPCDLLKDLVPALNRLRCHLESEAR